MGPSGHEARSAHEGRASGGTTASGTRPPSGRRLEARPRHISAEAGEMEMLLHLSARRPQVLVLEHTHDAVPTHTKD